MRFYYCQLLEYSGLSIGIFWKASQDTKEWKGKNQCLYLGRERKQVQCYRKMNFSSVLMKRNIYLKTPKIKVINSQNKFFMGKLYQAGLISVCQGISPSPLGLEEKQFDMYLNSEVHISRLVNLVLMHLLSGGCWSDL